MAGVNKAIILGRLGQNPEISYTQAGLAVCKFSLATSKKMKDGSEITSWHRCTAFGKAGELISQYVSKGQQLYIEGEIQYGQYEKDGITRYTTDIIVREFNFVGSGGGGQQGGYQNAPQQGGGYHQGGGGYQQRPAPNQGGGGGYQGGGGGFSSPTSPGATPPSDPGSAPSMPPEDDIPF